MTSSRHDVVTLPKPIVLSVVTCVVAALALGNVGCQFIRINGKTLAEIEAEKNAEGERGAAGEESDSRGSPAGSGESGSASGGSEAERKLAEATAVTEKFEALAKQKPERTPTDPKEAYRMAKAFAEEYEKASASVTGRARRPDGARMHGKTRADGTTEDPQSTSGDYIPSATAIKLAQRLQRAFEPVMVRWARGQNEAGWSGSAFEILFQVFNPLLPSPAAAKYGKERIGSAAPLEALLEVEKVWKPAVKKDSAGTYGLEGVCLYAKSPWNGKAFNSGLSMMISGDPATIYGRCVVDSQQFERCKRKDSPKIHMITWGAARVNASVDEVGRTGKLEQTFSVNSKSDPEERLSADVVDFRAVETIMECDYIAKRYQSGKVDRGTIRLASGQLVWLREDKLWSQ
jgi:hypothetical protein